MDLGRELATIAGFLRARGIRHAVVGGVALAGYGLARSTQDLDLVVDGDRQDEIVDWMESEGFATLHRSPGFSNHAHGSAERGRVDFVYVRNATRERLFAAVREVAGPQGNPVPVAAPEHLAAMKALAIASDPERLYQDLADVRFLLRLPGIELATVRAAFARHGLEGRLDELLASI